MKKIFIICSFMLLCGCKAGENIICNEYDYKQFCVERPGLKFQDFSNIVDDLNNYKELYKVKYDIKDNLYPIAYYGTYDDVVFITFDTTDCHSIEVYVWDFVDEDELTSLFFFMYFPTVFKNGEIYTFKETVENGILTNSIIEKMGDEYRNIIHWYIDENGEKYNDWQK